ncbi:ArsR/SmtB family transcription factor [Actinoallomurus sp. CA-150999]|uniref:ArsR/SmtB family transcription factor n=1 Tax=Actinoallomurus sp. CA-150999 TaxID=3239887 RepID=UPI003D8DACEE
MVRVLHYGAEDLARTRFATSPLGHLVHGLHNGPCSHRSQLRERWWRSVRRNIPARAEPLLELINADPSWTPPFLLPASAEALAVVEPAIEEELERLRDTSKEQITADLERFDRDPRQVRVPRLVQDLRDGGSRPLRLVVDSAHALFTACLAGDWPDLRRQLRDDLAFRTQTMMTAGPGGVFATLHPSVTWQDQALLFAPPTDPIRGDTRGRGFVLMPCAFGRDSVHPVLDRSQPILIYSARVQPPDTGSAVSDSLTALIGAGRARALRALATGGSTSDLALRLSVSAPTASAHAATLRRAGLISTRREGHFVRHELTLLGDSLLAANPVSRRFSNK